jgi:hypothetical protein
MPWAAMRVPNVCLLCGIPHNRHYVDGWVMWPAGVFLLLMGSSGRFRAT